MSHPDVFALLSRRQWIQRFMLGSAVSFGLGRNWSGVLLADIDPGTDRANIIPISLSLYPDLQMSGGSIQLRFTDQAAPITISRATEAGGEDVIYAVDSRCTHLGCTVGKWVSGVGMICPCHGSRYDVDGRLIYGVLGPGQGSLRQFKTAFDGNDLLTIEVPGLNLRINSIAVQTSASPGRRLRLSFPGRPGSEYRVRYTPDLAAPAQPVPFATTLDGPATATLFHVFGTTNTVVNVWVDNSDERGYYLIELLVAQVS